MEEDHDPLSLERDIEHDGEYSTGDDGGFDSGDSVECLGTEDASDAGNNAAARVRTGSGHPAPEMPRLVRSRPKGRNANVAAATSQAGRPNTSWRLGVKTVFEAAKIAARHGPAPQVGDPGRPPKPAYCAELAAFMALPSSDKYSEYMPGLTIALKVENDDDVLDPATTVLGLAEVQMLKVARSTCAFAYADARDKVAYLEALTRLVLVVDPFLFTVGDESFHRARINALHTSAVAFVYNADGSLETKAKGACTEGEYRKATKALLEYYLRDADSRSAPSNSLIGKQRGMLADRSLTLGDSEGTSLAHGYGRAMSGTPVSSILTRPEDADEETSLRLGASGTLETVRPVSRTKVTIVSVNHALDLLTNWLLGLNLAALTTGSPLLAPIGSVDATFCVALPMHAKAQGRAPYELNPIATERFSNEIRVGASALRWALPEATRQINLAYQEVQSHYTGNETNTLSYCFEQATLSLRARCTQAFAAMPPVSLFPSAGGVGTARNPAPNPGYVPPGQLPRAPGGDNDSPVVCPNYTNCRLGDTCAYNHNAERAHRLNQKRKRSTGRSNGAQTSRGSAAESGYHDNNGNGRAARRPPSAGAAPRTAVPRELRDQAAALGLPRFGGAARAGQR